jgi:hypothetical protein
MKKILPILFILAVLPFVKGCNPFAPGLSDTEDGSTVITDQLTVAGVFQNFNYAYKFKDTLIYGGLLHDDFKFTYKNFDRGDNPSWNRQMDMLKTYKLFETAYKIELLWNDSWSEVEYKVEDTMFVNVNRRFTLTVYYSATIYDHVYGNAFFRLRRMKPEEPWKIELWDDQSV